MPLSAVLILYSLALRFPGSQPVSFGVKDLAKLETQEYVLGLFYRPFTNLCGVSSFTIFFLLSYWVCEKSDGVRVLFLVKTDLNSNAQETYIVREPFACSGQQH